MTCQNIVFIDSRVAGYQNLTASLGADTEWHLLNAGQDGVEQMQRILSGRSGLESIQVVSHGSAGTLYLGSTVLNSGNLGATKGSCKRSVPACARLMPRLAFDGWSTYTHWESINNANHLPDCYALVGK